MENKTRQLCDFLVSLRYEDIGEHNIKDIRYKVLDWLACLIAAQNVPSVINVRSIMLEQGGNAHASIIGSKIKSSAINAAFCNGVAGHALEYDDTNKIAIAHPGALVLAAAFAVAESIDCTFEKFALAVVVGYEAMIRLGGAVNPQHYQTWHTTGTCGVFAATAAVGVLIELDAEQMEKAFGIASTMASGLVGVFGTDAKLVTVGNAAKNGILAAQLAQKGMSAPDDAFASPKGYAAATNSNPNLSFMVPQFADKLLIENAYYKIHASCGHTHSALDALQQMLSKENYSIDDVASIQIEVYKTALDLCREFNHQTASQAKFSLPYCIAVMMQFQQCTLFEFTPEILNSHAVEAWAKKVVVKENPTYTEAYPKLRWSRVRIAYSNGKTAETVIDLPIGKPPYAFIEKKYFSLAEMTITPQLALSIRNKVLSLKPQDKMTSLGNLLRTTADDITLKQ